jgi:hypothetical protein
VRIWLRLLATHVAEANRDLEGEPLEATPVSRHPFRGPFLDHLHVGSIVAYALNLHAERTGVLEPIAHN